MDLEAAMTSSVYKSLCTHALTTQSEEIMGLLIAHDRNEKTEKSADDADGENGTGNNCVSFVASLPLSRSDKRPDRVEIRPEDLVRGAELAEELSLKHFKTKDSLRIMGWYHSHPKITVLPSWVDLESQSRFQRMDPRFVGIILSVFQPRLDAYELKVRC